MVEIGELDQVIGEARVFVNRCERFLHESINEEEKMIDGEEA
jgi:hypothetical protein